MPTALEKVLQMKIVAVVAIHDAGHSDALADAVVEGGLPCAEITFRTGAAANAIRIMAKRGDILVGGGTVL
jgi:2-dehydro-3-deoxyphosphogluconate aldolase/(4S)-4-hydroxy-2-oxoglutarate aldolase